MMGARAASIVFDGIVLFLTWKKTRYPGFPSRKMQKRGLSTLLLRDSTLRTAVVGATLTHDSSVLLWVSVMRRPLHPIESNKRCIIDQDTIHGQCHWPCGWRDLQRTSLTSLILQYTLNALVLPDHGGLEPSVRWSFPA